MPQQCGHNYAADKPAERRPGECHHDHRRSQALRRVIAGQRRRSGKPAGDAEPGEEAQPAQYTKRRGERTRQRGQAENSDAGEQQWLTPKAVADRPRGQGARHDTKIGPQDRQRREVDVVNRPLTVPVDEIDQASADPFDGRDIEFHRSDLAVHGLGAE